MKKVAPIMLAVVLLLVALVYTGRREKGSGGPEDCVQQMFEAAREGRVTDYLEAFCEPLRASLENTAQRMGDEKFRQYIAGSAAPIMGMAFSEMNERGQNEITLRCELVFKDHNEVQRFLLKKIAGRWRIADMTPAERIMPPVPYGTKVYE